MKTYISNLRKWNKQKLYDFYSAPTQNADSDIKLDCEQSLMFFFAKLLHEKPKHASRDKRGRKPV